MRNSTNLTHGSFFTGIGGFDLGFERAGIRTLWQVERELFCQAVLATHWPHVRRHNDITTFDSIDYERPNIISGGFPCQDVSVAGKRAGLTGARTGLFFDACRIIGELQPRWLVLENVPGLFSSNKGSDFAVVIETLCELGYGVAWRTLDSRYFGVAQRRRRVFIVGRFGEPCPAEILFEPARSSGDSATGGETPAHFTPDTARSLTASCWKRHDDDTDTLDECVGFHSRQDPITSHERSLPLEAKAGQSVAYPLRAGRAVADAAGNEGNVVVCSPLQRLAGESQIGAEDASGGHLQVIKYDSKCSLVDKPTLACGGSGTHFDKVCASPDPDGMRNFTSLPEGLDSSRYRALGNAVTSNVAYWIAKRIVQWTKQNANE